MALDSIRDYENSWYYGLGLPPADFPRIVTTIYLKVSISDFLTLFSARTQQKPFFAYMPSGILLVGAGISLFVSSMLGALWPLSSLDNITTMGLSILAVGQPFMAAQKAMPIYVWFYCVMWWFLQDWIKIGAYIVMEKYNWFSYRTIMNPPVHPTERIAAEAAAAAKSPVKAAPAAATHAPFGSH